MTDKAVESSEKWNKEVLDGVINDMIDVVEKSKEEVYYISEEARKEYERLEKELEETRKKVVNYIQKNDKLEREVQVSRKHLSFVSREFDKYSEDEIRQVYEKTHELQTKLVVVRQEEKSLRVKRDELERRLIALEETVERATGILNKTSVILTYLNDEIKQVNTLIKDAQDKRAFSLKIIEAQEEERKKISRELHDGPTQMLANILLRSEIVHRTLDKNNIAEAKKELSDVQEMIRQSIKEVRHIIYDLRPMALDDLGLIPTLKKYVETTSEFHNTNIELHSIGEAKRLSTKYEVAFFRLIQESVQNAIKHAQPSLIEVKIEITDKRVTIVIKDDGVGFVKEKNKLKSFGLMGMRERVEMLDGEFEISSERNKGTKVFIKIPITNH